MSAETSSSLALSSSANSSTWARCLAATTFRCLLCVSVGCWSPMDLILKKEKAYLNLTVFGCAKETPINSIGWVKPFNLWMHDHKNKTTNTRTWLPPPLPSLDHTIAFPRWVTFEQQTITTPTRGDHFTLHFFHKITNKGQLFSYHLRDGGRGLPDPKPVCQSEKNPVSHPPPQGGHSLAIICP